MPPDIIVLNEWAAALQFEGGRVKLIQVLRFCDGYI